MAIPHFYYKLCGKNVVNADNNGIYGQKADAKSPVSRDFLLLLALFLQDRTQDS